VRYQQRVYNIVFHFVLNRTDADDVTQEVFLQAFRMLSTLRSEGAFATWLYRIAVNRARNFCRDRAQGHTISLEESIEVEEDLLERQVPDSSWDPAVLVQQQAIQEKVRQVIATLSEDHQAVVILHHLEGMSLDEIARTLAIPEGTVKSRLARARDELKRKLRSFVEE